MPLGDDFDDAIGHLDGGARSLTGYAASSPAIATSYPPEDLSQLDVAADRGDGTRRGRTAA